jgi:protein SCO1/2
MSRRFLLVIVGGFLVGALGAAALHLADVPAAPPVETSGTALIGGPFTLIDQNGKTITDHDFAGRYKLVFFGFTHCPDICPAELQVIAAALDKLGSKADKVVPIFITVDPDRDTPAVVGAFVKNFGPRFVGLSGSPPAIAAVAKEYRVAYSKVEQPGSANDYTVDHSALVYLMGPDGEYIDHFAYGTSAEAMAQALNSYL